MKDTSAICGLFCESCGIYIATQNNDEKEIERLAAMLKTTKDEIRCKGCRSTVLSPHCRNCEFRNCTRQKNIANCEDCDTFPCDAIKEFQKKAPHRAELFESANFRKKNGIQSWLNKMNDDYSCTSCGVINSPYYITCKKCGNDPGNEFTKRNISLFRK